MLSGNSLDSRVYLGDRGFLRRYGSKFSLQEMRSIFDEVSKFKLMGISSGDRRSAGVVSEVFGRGCSSRHIYHSRFLVNVSNSRGRIYDVKEVQGNVDRFCVDQDVVFNRNDYQIDEDLNIIEISQPYAVTIGGDWLDILIAHGRVDLIYEILDIFRILIPDYIKKILLSFRPSREFVSLLDDSWVSGVSVPVNILNIGDRRYDDVLRLIRGVSPIYAVHCLAGGLVPLKPALDYALLHVGAKACIVGATKIEQIRDLVVLSDNYLEAV